MSIKMTHENQNQPDLTPAQCRAARGLLNWSQDELASLSKLSRSTIAGFERGEREPTRANLSTLRRIFEDAGVEVIPENGGGVGVRFRQRQSEPKPGSAGHTN